MKLGLEEQTLHETDVKMVESERPDDVGIGDLVVFMLESAHGNTPVARGVQKVHYEMPSQEPGPSVIRSLLSIRESQRGAAEEGSDGDDAADLTSPQAQFNVDAKCNI